MKIVAKTNSGFLVEASQSELDMLAGKNSYNSNKPGYTDLAIGQVVDISAAYNQLHSFSKTVKSFSETATKLRAMAESLEKAPSVTFLTPEEASKLKSN